MSKFTEELKQYHCLIHNSSETDGESNADGEEDYATFLCHRAADRIEKLEKENHLEEISFRLKLLQQTVEKFVQFYIERNL